MDSYPRLAITGLAAVALCGFGGVLSARVKAASRRVFLKFRFDFALVSKYKGGLYVVDVECDGADYHQNVSADLKRDGYLASWGIPVIRATGEQIYKEPENVSGRASSMLVQVMG
jgi:very-short-patch-repair endonuclease